jgi:hypothetical protein
MDWIDLAQERDQWRALVIMVINLQVPLNAGSCCIAAQLATSQGGFSSMTE